MNFPDLGPAFSDENSGLVLLVLCGLGPRTLEP